MINAPHLVGVLTWLLTATPPSSEVSALARASHDHIGAGRCLEGLAAMQRAHALDPSPTLAFNVATILHRMQHCPEAAQAYDRFLALPAIDDDWRAQAETRRAAVRACAAAPVTVIEVSPPEATLRLDECVFPTPWRGRLAPGSHVLRVSADGHVEARRTIVAGAGQSAEIRVALLRAGGPEPADDGWSAAPWVALGLGAAALATTAALLVSADSDIETGDRWRSETETSDSHGASAINDKYESAQNSRLAASAFGAAGAAAIVFGSLLLASEESRPEVGSLGRAGAVLSFKW